MKPLADDTDRRAEEVQIEIWRSWTPQEQLEHACNLIVLARQRVEQAIREQHADLRDVEVRLHFLRRAHGADIAARVGRYLGVSFDA